MAKGTIEVIEMLIETCRDGQAGYLDAADHARNGALRDFFQRQSMERSRFAGELEKLARQLGSAEPDRGPSMAGKLHRAWIDVKRKLGGGDSSVLLSVEAGEDNAARHYREAMGAGLPPEVHTIIERQAENIFDAHEQVQTLCNMRKQAA
jgi:uncharacterized protein (TIGR02284 family)